MAELNHLFSSLSQLHLRNACQSLKRDGYGSLFRKHARVQPRHWPRNTMFASRSEARFRQQLISMDIFSVNDPSSRRNRYIGSLWDAPTLLMQFPSPYAAELLSHK